ncbi:hypothetical protein [Pseudonocardia nigra]|uniref:hypothetical protein n=1 Tax=Pseudonocardia nigra TaxID=1921578 RepID=UPI001C5D3D99|nr:hypothetical protein [Pseudonocardia nigra]
MVSRPRTPVIAGLSGDAGTSTLAAALHARDAGPLDGAADVIACRGTDAALRQAAVLAGAPTGPHPVLAVLLEPGLPTDGVATRLSALQPRFGAVVTLPHVGRWHGAPTPSEEAAAVLALPAHHVTRPLRAYAAALRLVVAAVVGSGLPARSAPPTLIRPRPTAPAHAPRVIRRAAPVRPARLLGPAPVRAEPLLPAAPEPDDDTLEADHLRSTAAAGRAG